MQQAAEQNNKNKIAYFFGAIFVSCFLLFISVQGVQAQDSLSLRITPAIVEHSMEPGETYSFILTVENLSPSKNTYYFNLRDIKSLSSGGQPIFALQDEQTRYSLREWVALPEPLELDSGETGQREVIITAPESAGPGGHFGAIFASLVPDIPDEEIASGIGANVGSVMNIRIAGDINEDAQIREFVTDKTVYTKPTVKFSTRVENLGNVLIRPRGPIEVTNIFGKTVATLTMNDTGRGVFPGQIRQFELTWEGDTFTFGRYQALMGLVYGQEARKNMESAISFWVLPMNIIGPVVGGILVLIIGVFIFIRWMVSRKLKEAEHSNKNLVWKNQGAEVDRRLSNTHAAPVSKLAMIALSLLILALIFLIILFFVFG